MTREEWKDMKNDIKYDFQRDNYYAEIKEQDMMNNRLAVLGVVDAYVGKYYSVEWIRKNVLRQTEDEMKEMDQQMAIEGQAEAEANAEQQQNNDQNIANTQPQKEKSFHS